MAGSILTSIISILVFFISAIPLYLAVNFLGGKTSLLKTALVTFITGIIVTAIRYQFETWGGLLGFILLIWIYHEMFRLRWLKAFLAWVLQFVFIAIFYILAVIFFGLVLGISFLSLF